MTSEEKLASLFMRTGNYKLLDPIFLYSKKDLKHVEEKEEAPAAGAAERQAHSVGGDEDPNFKNNYSFLLQW